MERTSRLGALAAGVGAADTALFVVRRPTLFRRKPRRAVTNVGVLAAWLALAASLRARDGRSPGRARALAVSLFAANAGMLAAHVRHGIVRPRIFIGPATSAIALADALRVS